MEYSFLPVDPKADYATAWRIDVEEARRAALLPACTRILLLLFFTAFFFQAIAALLRVYVNPDGITYLHIANLLAQGNLEEGLQEYGFNVFFYSLVFFQWLGLDPFHAGVWLNAVISSLTILPLFGWVRRMFDGRIAIIASLLYAFHPIILSVGSAIMRGPLFWLFFNFTIYATWRAITEVRLRWFLMAGCGLTLAIHVRSEAWCLVIPIVLWMLGRWWFAVGYRVRLCLGTLLLLAIVPGSIAIMNVTVFRACPQWGIFRPSHVRQVTVLYHQVKAKLQQHRKSETKEIVKQPNTPSPTKPAAKLPPTPSKKKTTAVVTTPPSPPSYAMAGLRRAIVCVAKSYSYLYGIYGLIGVCVWRGRRRLALHAMFLMAVPLFALIWHRSCNADVSPRYFLPIVFISLPMIAFGLLWICRKIATCCGCPDHQNDQVEKAPSKSPFCVLIAILAFTLAINCFGAVWGSSHLEAKECELGKWVQKNFGPNQNLFCINRQSRIVAWYANTDQQHYIFYPVHGPNKIKTSDQAFYHIFQERRPPIVFCWEKHRRPEGMPGLFETLEKNNYFGYEVVQTGVMENVGPEVIVLVRKDREK